MCLKTTEEKTNKKIKTLHRKLNTWQDEPHEKTGWTQMLRDSFGFTHNINCRHEMKNLLNLALKLNVMKYYTLGPFLDIITYIINFL